MKTFLIIVGILAIIAVVFMYCAIYIGARSNEVQDLIMLQEWQSKLQIGDKVRVEGIIYVIQAIEGRVALVTNYSDQIFVLINDCYPVK